METNPAGQAGGYTGSQNIEFTVPVIYARNSMDTIKSRFSTSRFDR